MCVIIQVVLKPLHRRLPKLLHHLAELLVCPVQLTRLHAPQTVFHPLHHPSLHADGEVDDARVENGESFALADHSKFDVSFSVCLIEELLQKAKKEMSRIAVMRHWLFGG